MITTKQRAYLRSLANALEPSMQIGKEGISDNSIIQIDQMLTARELIKIKMLPSYDLSLRDAFNRITEETNSEQVQLIGRTLVLYRKNIKKKNSNIQLPL